MVTSNQSKETNIMKTFLYLSHVDKHIMGEGKTNSAAINDASPMLGDEYGYQGCDIDWAHELLRTDGDVQGYEQEYPTHEIAEIDIQLPNDWNLLDCLEKYQWYESIK